MGAALGWLAFLAVAAPTAAASSRTSRQAGYALAAGAAGGGRRPASWWPNCRACGSADAVAIEWEEAELIAAARERGRGIVFLTPHLGCFEVTAQAYAARFGPITVLYRPARKAWLRDLVDTPASAPGLHTAPDHAGGRAADAQGAQGRRGGRLAARPGAAAGLGVWAPFFGRAGLHHDPVGAAGPADRRDRAAGLGRAAAVGPRLSGSTCGPGPSHGRGDPNAAAAQVNRQMEGLVRECPQQYLWGYARYKAARARSRCRDEPSRHSVHARCWPAAAGLDAGDGLRAGLGAVRRWSCRAAGWSGRNLRTVLSAVDAAAARASWSARSSCTFAQAWLDRELAVAWRARVVRRSAWSLDRRGRANLRAPDPR